MGKTFIDPNIRPLDFTKGAFSVVTHVGERKCQVAAILPDLHDATACAAEFERMRLVLIDWVASDKPGVSEDFKPF